MYIQTFSINTTKGEKKINRQRVTNLNMDAGC